jgi:hypothetical protein
MKGTKEYEKFSDRIGLWGTSAFLGQYIGLQTVIEHCNP